MVIDNQQKIYYNVAFMKLRKWQQKVIDEFPDIVKNYRKFILKAPTGAGKTVLADMLKEEHLPNAFRIDGDDMRELFSNKDYSIKGRVENVGTAQRIAHYLNTFTYCL